VVAVAAPRATPAVAVVTAAGPDVTAAVGARTTPADRPPDAGGQRMRLIVIG
jgi:hypothetical protein